MPTNSELFASALKHHQSGRLQAAEHIYRQILAVDPRHADALHLLGLVHLQTGKCDAAVELIQRAIALKGKVASYHSNLGGAYQALGKIPEALAAYRRALQLNPDFAEAHSNLGNLYKDSGKLDDAIACYRKSLKLKPDHVEAHNNLGVAYNELGKFDDAIACYQRALKRKADFAEAHNNLGITLRELGRFGDAAASYRRALVLRPNYAEAHNNLGNALKDDGNVSEAIACYRRALAIKPDSASALSNLGDALKEQGDFARAEEYYRAALRHDAASALAHYKLAELVRGALPESDVAAQRRLLDESALPDAQRMYLHFGLAYVHDARDQYADAAAHLERGKALQFAQWRRRGQQYDPGEHESLVTRIMSLCTADFFERTRGFGSESELPVFVVGLPRSGTTLIEQIVASHSHAFGAGESRLANDTLVALGGSSTEPIDGLRRLDRPAVARAAARHLESLRALSPDALRIVDKMPDNYLLLGMLAVLFPQAKFIHCRRDLRDVAVSCWMTRFQDIRWANDQEHIASRFRQYRRIMAHWQAVLPASVLDIDYEETVVDLEGVARRLVAWCGLEWEPGCLDFHRSKRSVRTASAVQVRQPVFTRSAGRWKHYEPYLTSLFARLEMDMQGVRS